jgi:DNA-binding response OmpR family regulator
MSEAKTILIVDDDLDILEQYTLILKADGYNVVQAAAWLRPMKPS